ncbi:hypothetical protein [Klebsiella phage 05F01]|nr:hypothetical protein [Klebsiella phage 05F01]
MLDIKVSRIRNVVDFTVDKNSLREAKESIKGIKDFIEGLQPQMNLNKFKRQMREAERYAKAIQRQMVNIPGGVPGNTPVPPRTNKPTSSNTPRPTNTNRPSAEERQRQRRLDTAEVRQRNFDYRAQGFTGVDKNTQKSIQREVAATLDLYRKGEITAMSMNQTLAQQLDTLRRIHRQKMADLQEEMRLQRRAERAAEVESNRRRRRFDKIREGGLSLNPGMVAGGLGVAAAYEVGSRTIETLNSTAERNNLISRGAENVQTSPAVIQAMTAWGQRNGVDSANIIKSIDNIKDVRERLGNSAMNSTFDQKTGKWKGGDSGINDIMNQFGWNVDQIKQYQNNPFDFIGAVVNEGQRRGMNSAQIGRLMENLGDDLMHYQRMFSKNGEEFIKMLNEVNRSGALLSQEQIDASQEYSRLANQLNLVSQGMQNNFLTGFMENFKGDDLYKNAQILDESAKWLGQQIGELVKHFGELVTSIKDTVSTIKGWYDKLTSGPFAGDTPEGKAAVAQATSGYTTGVYQNTSAPWDHTDPNVVALSDTANNSLVSHFKDLLGFGDGTTRMPSLENLKGTNSFYGYGTLNNGGVNITLPEPTINVNVLPDGSQLGQYIDYTAKATSESFMNQLTLGVNSATSASGSN